MEFQISIKPSAQKKLDKLPKRDYYRILSVFSLIAKNPFLGKKLEGEYQGQYTYRVWPYRIIYQVYKKELLVLIIKVGHRQGIY